MSSCWLASPALRPRFVHGGRVDKRLTAAYYKLVLVVIGPQLFYEKHGVRRGVGSGADIKYVKRVPRGTFDAGPDALGPLPNIGDFYPRGHDASAHTCTPAQHKLLSDLFVLTQRALEAAHREGTGNGTNLLVALAKGKITADELRG